MNRTTVTNFLKSISPVTSQPPTASLTLDGQARNWLDEAAKCVTITIQLSLLVLLLRRYQLETVALSSVLVLVTQTFAIHHFLPAKARLPMFVGVCFTSVFIIFGWHLSVWILGIGLCLVGLCHLPVAFKYRVILVILAGVVVATLRSGVIGAAGLGAIWPVIGSMFMFRIIVYLYDMRHKTAPFDLWRALAYFFMVPNICLLLFPVVDYRTFCRTYYNENPFRIYQVGVVWIFRGLLHLLLYRAINFYGVMEMSDAQDAGDVIQQMLATYSLYLRVSGTFHIAVGVLRLFGFNLPETHHLYFLASSFTDYWRRINIYWKDFITKLIFYPAYLKLRKLGPTGAMVVATFLAIFATWMLHSYQWFWLRGAPLITAIDIAFWLMLALLLAVNVFIESKAKKRKATHDLRSKIIVAGKTMATFTTLLILWSMWSADSFESWFEFIGHLRSFGAKDLMLSLGLLATIGIASILFGQSKRELTEGAVTVQRAADPPFKFWRSACITGFIAAILVVSTKTEVQGRMPPRLGLLLENVMDHHGTLQLQRGYYEDLVQVGKYNTDLHNTYFSFVAPAPTYENVSYGPNAQHFLDLWIPKSSEPTALIVEIHGGGFDSGSKTKTRTQTIVNRALEHGIAFASINHRYVHFTKQEMAYGSQRTSVQGALGDCARAIQFLRYHAEEYMIDKTRIGVFGGSSGAGAALWMGLHDDMADPDNEDPVLRESTRIAAMAMISGQFTYDMKVWSEVFVDRFGDSFQEQSKMFKAGPNFYGLTEAEYNSSIGEEVRADVDLRSLISPDDPPIYIINRGRDEPLKPRGDIDHIPFHAELIRDRYNELGLEVVCFLPGVRPEDKRRLRDSESSMLQFFVKHLGVAD